MNVKTLGIDIAKNIFQLYGVDSYDKKVMQKRIARDDLSSFIANLPKCTIIMESCGGANYWARVFMRSGHVVKLISPQLVVSQEIF